MPNFTEICPMGAELILSDRHDETDSRLDWRGVRLLCKDTTGYQD